MVNFSPRVYYFLGNGELLDEYNAYFNFSFSTKYKCKFGNCFEDLYAHMASMDIIPAPRKSARYVIS